ncbi:MAG: putative toxin-antitoxin system toxin component, PIN family [Terricaulis sp.]
MRVVLDTNVLVAGMRSPSGASAKLILAALSGRIALVANAALFAEYEAVMTRREHLAAAHVSQADIVAVLDDLARVIHPADRDFSWRPQLSDPDDEMVLEAAINGQAEAIATFEIGTFTGAGARFGIRIMTPSGLWSMLKL